MPILNHFHHLTLTNDQHNALQKIEAFLQNQNDAFILQGYAGSGKTTLLKGLVDYFESTDQKFELMAPTGRAAKVINQKTGKHATTIHKSIYSFSTLNEVKGEEDEETRLVYYYDLVNNPDLRNTIFLVDESSMISDVSSEGEFIRFGSGQLLKDLIRYSRIQQPTINTKFIFIGDPAQLPPTGMNTSPALDPEYLQDNFKLKVNCAEIKEVKRQAATNGILKAANNIRQSLTSGFFNDFDLRENKTDIFNPPAEALIDTFNQQEGSKIIITFKNKTALAINRRIRKLKYGADIPIREGDKVIFGGNNYNLGVMNGEFAIVADAGVSTISREIAFKIKGGGGKNEKLVWRWVQLIVPEIDGGSRTVEGYILEDYLYGDNFLRPEQQQALYVDFRSRHQGLKPGTPEFADKISKDPFFNCILLKYGYAVTCHKAQGGEWDNAFIIWDKGVNDEFNFWQEKHNKTGKTNADFYRWAYTSVTRASKKLFCLNPPYFTSFSTMTFVDVEVQKAFSELIGKKEEVAELKLEGEYLELVNSLGLYDQPVQIQDHLIKIYYNVQKQYIDIVQWERIGYEIRYYFKREKDTAALKFWINGKNEFKASFQKLPGGTNSDQLFSDVAKILENTTTAVIIERQTIESVIDKIEFDLNLEEEKPFLKILYNYINSIAERLGISIEKVDHYQWRERYSFRRGEERAVIDFEYDKKGFFKRILPLANSCNSSLMLQEIRNQISQHQQPSDVI